MATIQYGSASAYDVHEHQLIGAEDVAWLPAECSSGDEAPGVELDLRAFGNGWNAPPQPHFALMTVPSGDPNATPSDKADASNAYRPESHWLEDALAALAAVDEEHVPESHWLEDALAALAEVDDEIAEEELPPVDGATKAEAERILKALAWRAPAPTVYPTQDAEIALHFKTPGRTGTVVILLSDGGRADCHAYVDGTSRRAHYDSSLVLPNAFILDLLRRLTSRSQAAVSTPDAGFLQSGTTFLLTNLLQTR